MKNYNVTLRRGGGRRLLVAFMQQVRDGAEQPGCNPHQVICAAASPLRCISQFTIRVGPTASKEISLSNKGDFGQFVSGCAFPSDGARL
jgi:hypothetical protein